MGFYGQLVDQSIGWITRKLDKKTVLRKFS
jgi:hypothetical protein